MATTYFLLVPETTFFNWTVLLCLLFAVKYKLAILVFGLLPTIAEAQNLVPNGGFEKVINCPLGLDALQDDCAYWYKSIQVPGVAIYDNPSPDWYHACSGTSVAGVPQNIFGYQFPEEGDGYAGFIAYDDYDEDYREILGVELNSPLVVGHEYFVEFFIVRGAGTAAARAANNIGVKFSNLSVFQSSESAVDNSSHFHVEDIIVDSENWMQESFVFTADSTYEFVHFGNFYDDAHTDTITLADTNNRVAYYFIDNVSVSDLTSVNDFRGDNKPKIIQNIITESLQVESDRPITSIEVFSITGDLVVKRNIARLNDLYIDVSELSRGIYNVRIVDGRDAVTVLRFLKI